jgi:hypothetical protein
MKSSSIIHSKRYLTLTQANNIIQKYKEAAEQANKNSELEAQIKKVQDSLEKEKEKSYQEF